LKQKNQLTQQKHGTDQDAQTFMLIIILKNNIKLTHDKGVNDATVNPHESQRMKL
jgi:hypothetical protein